MDFYKKLVKAKDAASILSEKEYKCVSLQAIANEAIKENNKKSLKELVEEINEHLTDLRAIKDDKEAKNREKCAQLIKKFEDCLVKIAGNNFLNVLSPIMGQLQELQNQINIATRDNNPEELKKLVDRMERNIMVIKNIPEVKNTKNSENEQIREVVNKYTSLLNKVLSHINEQKRYRISNPILLETTQNQADENISSQQLKKIPVNEVEEKLKLMRQKRLNRLSTFVDQQTKLAEERSTENSPKNVILTNKSFDDLSRIPDQADVIMKPSLYKAAAQERLLKSGEDKTAMVKKEQTHYQNAEVKSQSVVASVSGSSSRKGGTSADFNKMQSSVSSGGKIQEKSVSEPKADERKPTSNEEKNISKKSNEFIKQTSYSGEVTSLNKTNFPKSELTRSFAERQIENAREQSEKPRVQLKSSNSTRTTPPRTPTQIRKIFNSINACVLGANNKSIEDLPSEFKSPLEQQLKNFQFKNQVKGYGEGENPEVKSELERSSRTNSFKEKGISEHVSRTIVMPKELPPPPLPPKTKRMPLEKPVALSRKNVITKQRNDGYEEIKFDEKVKDEFIVNPIGKSASQSQVPSVTIELNSNKNINEETTKNKIWRSSLNPDDLVMVRHNKSDFFAQEPTDYTITIKRDSKAYELPAERHSFSTFRSSTESVKDEYNIDNPLYGIVDKQPILQTSTTTKLSRQNSISMDAMLIAAKAKELRNVDFNMLESEFGDAFKRSRKPSYRRELSSEVNRFIALEPIIAKLEFIIQVYMGLKRDESYLFIDKLLTKYYVKVDEVPINSSFDEIEKSNLLERLTKASRDLENRVIKNENLLVLILKEQVEMIGEKHEIA